MRLYRLYAAMSYWKGGLRMPTPESRLSELSLRLANTRGGDIKQIADLQDQIIIVMRYMLNQNVHTITELQQAIASKQDEIERMRRGL